MQNIRHKAETIFIDYVVTLLAFGLGHCLINKPFMGAQSFPWVAWFIWANLWTFFLKEPLMKLIGKLENKIKGHKDL